MTDKMKLFCPSCQSINQFAAEADNKVLALKLNTEADQQAGMTYNIRSIPTLALFNNGKELQRMSGGLALHHLKQWVAQYLG